MVYLAQIKVNIHCLIALIHVYSPLQVFKTRMEITYCMLDSFHFTFAASFLIAMLLLPSSLNFFDDSFLRLPVCFLQKKCSRDVINFARSFLLMLWQSANFTSSVSSCAHSRSTLFTYFSSMSLSSASWNIASTVNIIFNVLSDTRRRHPVLNSFSMVSCASGCVSSVSSAVTSLMQVSQVVSFFFNTGGTVACKVVEASALCWRKTTDIGVV